MAAAGNAVCLSNTRVVHVARRLAGAASVRELASCKALEIILFGARAIPSTVMTPSTRRISTQPPQKDNYARAASFPAYQSASAAAFLRCLARSCSRRLSTRAASMDEFRGDGEATLRALAPAPAGAVPPWHTVETRKVDNSSGVMIDGASISTSSTWRQANTDKTRSCRFMSGNR